MSMQATELPILPAFPANTLEECGNGACGNCGLCCQVMGKTVPSEHGNPDSELLTLQTGQRCPQLVEFRGRYFCAVHEHKQDHPSLQQCREWSGTGNGLMQLLAKAEEWICEPADHRQVAEIEELATKGLFTTVEITMDFAQLINTAKRYIVELEYDSPVIFSLLRLEQHCKMLSLAQASELVEQAGLDTGNPAHTVFIRSYIGPVSQLANTEDEQLVMKAERRLGNEHLSVSMIENMRRLLLQILLRNEPGEPATERAAVVLARVEQLLPQEQLGNRFMMPESSQPVGP